jgi:hypothetical protein
MVPLRGPLLKLERKTKCKPRLASGVKPVHNQVLQRSRTENVNTHNNLVQYPRMHASMKFGNVSRVFVLINLSTQLKEVTCIHKLK